MDKWYSDLKSNPIGESLVFWERERNVLFNDALNTFYLRLYGVRHMVKDHSDSEKWNPLPPHRLLLSISSKGSFICTIPGQDNTYHGLCYTSRGALAGTSFLGLVTDIYVDRTNHLSFIRKEGNVLFNDALNTFYLWLYGVRHIVKDHSNRREETRCRNMGSSFRLTARVLLYAPSHRQDSTYHSLCYTCRGAPAGARNKMF